MLHFAYSQLYERIKTFYFEKGKSFISFSADLLQNEENKKVFIAPALNSKSVMRVFRQKKSEKFHLLRSFKVEGVFVKISIQTLDL